MLAKVAVLMKYTDGLTKLFAEIKEKDKIDDLSMEYKKFAEWLRIESVEYGPCPNIADRYSGSRQRYIIYSWQRITHPSCLHKRSEYIP